MLYKKIVGFIRYDDRIYEKKQEKIKKIIRKIFAKVKLEKIRLDNTIQDVIIIVPKYKKYSILKKKLISIQINKYIKKNNITCLICEKNLKILKNTVVNECVLNEKFYMRNNIIQIFKYIFNISKNNINLENIYVLVNEYSKQNLELIDKLTKEFKTVNIITENIRRYKRLEDRYYKQGVLITVANNKRKSLNSAKQIINVDFDKNKIMLYNIYPNSIIINLSNYEMDINKRFNGVLINNVEVRVNKDKDCFIREFYGNINTRVFLEILMKRNINRIEYTEKINQEFDVNIDKLIGIRGSIENNEILSIKS